MTDKVIVYGGRGGLGVVIVDAFKVSNKTLSSSLTSRSALRITKFFEAAGFWVLSVDIAANDAADANVLVRLCQHQHQHQQNRIALYTGKHLHSSSTCTTTVYITQVSLKDGWVDQEAAVIHGVDNAVRGAKVSLERIGYKLLCLFEFLSSCNIFLSGCGCNQHGRWVGGGL